MKNNSNSRLYPYGIAVLIAMSAMRLAKPKSTP
jgi:hypothetical protein